jgi:hypothetical protein
MPDRQDYKMQHQHRLMRFGLMSEHTLRYGSALSHPLEKAGKPMLVPSWPAGNQQYNRKVKKFSVS